MKADTVGSLPIGFLRALSLALLHSGTDVRSLSARSCLRVYRATGASQSRHRFLRSRQCAPSATGLPALLGENFATGFIRALLGWLLHCLSSISVRFKPRLAKRGLRVGRERVRGKEGGREENEHCPAQVAFPSV